MQTRLHLAGTLLAALLTSSCVALPGNPEKMSPEQLTAWAKDRNANIACGTATNVAGTAIMSYVVLDKGVIANGAVTVDRDCKITISNTPPAKP